MYLSIFFNWLKKYLIITLKTCSNDIFLLTQIQTITILVLNIWKTAIYSILEFKLYNL